MNKCVMCGSIMEKVYLKVLYVKKSSKRLYIESTMNGEVILVCTKCVYAESIPGQKVFFL